VRARRHELGLHPVYKRVDTCAAEFATDTAYLYSTYEDECEAAPTDREKIVVLGGGPNRIGQGIEFDYCCVHASLALRDDGYETIMINCNPETVSTDYDTSDRLYFEPLTFEDVSEVLRVENPAGVAAAGIGYPLVVRPSYVLGGRAMEIVYSDDELKRYIETAVAVSNDSPVLLDRFLDDAIEVDVDAICDGKEVMIGGIMEHIEQAGVHSGDSGCSLPPYSLSQQVQNELRRQMSTLALELGVVGLVNAQFAIQGDEIYIIEVNPRASRTVPFVSKATGVPLASVAARCMAGKSLAEQGCTSTVDLKHYAVKESVFPFVKFCGHASAG